jgi:hypothetical protein
MRELTTPARGVTVKTEPAPVRPLSAAAKSKRTGVSAWFMSATVVTDDAPSCTGGNTTRPADASTLGMPDASPAAKVFPDAASAW